MTTPSSGIPLALIAAVAENGAIGLRNRLPWHIASEYRYFQDTVAGHPAIMGRNTFAALGQPLARSANIVVTRARDLRASGVLIVHSLDEAIALGRQIAGRDKAGEIFICGGADIYRLTLPLAQRLYLTQIHLNPQADTFFPPFDQAGWRETRREFHKALPGEDGDYTLTILERK
jgi:dihydrofolate reductase